MVDSAVGSVEYERFEQHLVAGGEHLRKNRVVEARAEFQAALQLRPEDRKALGLVGLTAFRLQEYGDALTVYQKLVDGFPTDASYRLNLGLVHLKLGKPDAAIAELMRTRELDPSMSKAVGYLGLAYARQGQYLQAYESFKQVGQEDLASEMQQYLNAAQVAEVKARLEGGREAAAPVAIERAGEISTPIESVPDMTDEVEITIEPERAPSQPAPTRAATSDEPAPPDEFDDAESAPGAVVAELNQGVISQAVRIAMPSAAAESAATRGAAGHQPPLTLSEFATARLIRPDDSDHPFEISAGGVLVVRVRGRVMSRTEGVIVSGGELAYEPATRRVRGAAVDEPFGGERPLFIVTGEGHLVASPLGNHFAAVSLDDDVLYLREDLVFSFEERLRWENGFVPGSDAKISVVQFRGTGCVALRTHRPTLAVKLAPQRVLYVDADALAGWVGRVVPRVVAPAAGGEASALFVECSGEGVVLLECEDDESGTAEEP